VLIIIHSTFFEDPSIVPTKVVIPRHRLPNHNWQITNSVNPNSSLTEQPLQARIWIRILELYFQCQSQTESESESQSQFQCICVHMLLRNLLHITLTYYASIIPISLVIISQDAKQAVVYDIMYMKHDKWSPASRLTCALHATYYTKAKANSQNQHNPIPLRIQISARLSSTLLARVPKPFSSPARFFLFRLISRHQELTVA
jgi:hypothetical protein